MQCLERGVYTSDIIEKIRRNRLRPSVLLCDQYLQVELTDIRSKIQFYKHQILKICDVTSSLTLLFFCRYQKFCRSIMDRVYRTESERFKKWLVPDKMFSNCMLGDLDQHIINLSTKLLSVPEKQALCRGLNFCLPPKPLDRNIIDAEVENAFQECLNLIPNDKEGVPSFKANLVRLSSAYARTPIEKGVIQKQHLQALEDLKKNANILISKPDKGDGVVILDGASYVEKMKEILSDNTKFVLDSKQEDETRKLSSHVYKLVMQLQYEEIIKASQLQKFTKGNNQIPRLYGLPKVHKSNVPLRPILSMIGSPVHSLSRWLVRVLKPVADFYGQFVIKDTFQFVDLAKEFDLSSITMFSFDVKSLFTNVPVTQTIDIIISTISEFQLSCSVPLDLLRELLTVCTTNMQFLFDGQYYRQIDGVAMGSCLGPILANIFMGFVELKLQNTIEEKCRFYRRYVDDCFLLVGEEHDINDILDQFTSIRPKIEFTMERESEGSFAFLDVLVTRRTTGSSKLSIFRKYTWRGLYTNFHSFLPM